MPSAYDKACPLFEAETKPRRLGLAIFSASVQSTAVKPPVLPASPTSFAWLEALVHVQAPGAVATTRTRNVGLFALCPSQKPQTFFANPGPLRSTQTSASVYGLAYVPAALSVSSTSSQTCTSPPLARRARRARDAAGAAAARRAHGARRAGPAAHAAGRRRSSQRSRARFARQPRSAS